MTLSNTLEILHSEPRIRSYKNFLTALECQQIIEYAQGHLVDSAVIGPNGENALQYDHRNSGTTAVTESRPLPVADQINDRLSELIGIDKSRFETLVITGYQPGQEFKTHPDYFHDSDNVDAKKATKSRCSYGGNRISTVILYLNNVGLGGETYFPYLDLCVVPEQGKLLQFDYGYSDAAANLHTYHAGMPVLAGEKWIVTVWIREFPVTQSVTEYKTFNLESEFTKNLQDIEYNLECGPSNDIKTLSIDLPANTDPTNTIVVAFTSGMDSSLLLYLLAAMNSIQPVPYLIQPFTVHSAHGSLDGPIIWEAWTDIVPMIDWIREELGPNARILDIKYHQASPKVLRQKQPNWGMKDFFNNGGTRFHKHKYIYVGTNQYPDSGDSLAAPPWPRLTSKLHGKWRNPFINLKKYHILDAIIKLGLVKMLELTSKCPVDHMDLLDPCPGSWACQERRWAFTKINKHDLGIKYFIDKEK